MVELIQLGKSVQSCCSGRGLRQEIKRDNVSLTKILEIHGQRCLKQQKTLKSHVSSDKHDFFFFLMKFKQMSADL